MMPVHIMCRICLEMHNKLNDIFNSIENDVSVSKMMFDCGSVKVSPNDNVTNVCNDCLSNLISVYKLREQIIASDLLLKSIDSELGNYKSEQETPASYENLKFKKQCQAQEHEKNLFCKECNKTFKNNYFFEVHKSKHTGIKPFVCETCNKSFSMRWVLKLHSRIHTGVKPYSCDICRKLFRFCSSLSSHKLIHSGIRPYKCETCNKAFTQLNGLKVHKKIHTGEKLYICEICSERVWRVS